MMFTGLSCPLGKNLIATTEDNSVPLNRRERLLKTAVMFAL